MGNDNQNIFLFLCRNSINNRSCLICGHALVCSPLRGITRFMQEFQQKGESNISFEAYEIAKICKQFVPTATIKTLQEGT